MCGRSQRQWWFMVVKFESGGGRGVYGRSHRKRWSVVVVVEFGAEGGHGVCGLSWRQRWSVVVVEFSVGGYGVERGT